MSERHHRPDRDSAARHPSDRLGDLLRGVAGRERRHHPETPEGERPADLGARIANLEDDVREVRTRINALFFAVIAAALGDLMGRLVIG